PRAASIRLSPVVRTPLHRVLDDVGPVTDPGEQLTRLGEGELTVGASKTGIAQPDGKRALRRHLTGLHARFRVLHLLVQAVQLLCDRAVTRLGQPAHDPGTPQGCARGPGRREELLPVMDRGEVSAKGSFFG